jgi:hypothetical protein
MPQRGALRHRLGLHGGGPLVAVRGVVRYANERTQFGKPISGFQLTQAKLADMTLELAKGQLLSLHLGRRKDAGRLRPEQVSLGKLNNVREALEICRTSRTILGANGISGEYPVMRHANNLESVLTYEGTVEMHTLVVGQALTGHARLPLSLRGPHSETASPSQRTGRFRCAGRGQPIRMSLELTNSSAPALPSSRPVPDRLTPPKGSSGASALTTLTKTMPALIRSATRRACSSSVEKT